MGGLRTRGARVGLPRATAPLSIALLLASALPLHLPAAHPQRATAPASLNSHLPQGCSMQAGLGARGLEGRTCALSLHAAAGEGEAGHGEVEQGSWGAWAGGGCLSLRGGGKAREKQRWRQQSEEDDEEGAGDEEEERPASDGSGDGSRSGGGEEEGGSEGSSAAGESGWESAREKMSRSQLETSEQVLVLILCRGFRTQVQSRT